MGWRAGAAALRPGPQAAVFGDRTERFPVSPSAVRQAGRGQSRRDGAGGGGGAGSRSVLPSASVHARCRRCRPSWVCQVLRDKVFTEGAKPDATELGTAESWRRSERVMVLRARTRLRRGKAVTALDPRAAWELKRSSFSGSFIPSAAGDGCFPAEARRCSGQPRVPASGRWLPWKDSQIAFESAAGQPVLPTVCLSLTPRGWTRRPR